MKLSRVSVMLKYGVVGAFGAATHLGLLILFVEFFQLPPVISSVMGFIIVLLISYYLNNRWTFTGARTGLWPMVKYTMVSVTGLLLNIGIMYAAVHWLYWHYTIGQGVAMVAVPISNFLFNYFWTFRQTDQANDNAGSVKGGSQD